MAVDFNDPTTWDEDLSEADALNLGIFALNTLAYPDASSAEQLDALDFFTEGAIAKLAEMVEART